MKPDVVWTRPDTIVPAKGNTLTLGQKARRVVLLDHAARALGGASRLAGILGIGERAVKYKLSADQGLSDEQMCAVARAVELRADELVKLADDMRASARG